MKSRKTNRNLEARGHTPGKAICTKIPWFKSGLTFDRSENKLKVGNWCNPIFSTIYETLTAGSTLPHHTIAHLQSGILPEPPWTFFLHYLKSIFTHIVAGGNNKHLVGCHIKLLIVSTLRFSWIGSADASPLPEDILIRFTSQTRAVRLLG